MRSTLRSSYLAVSLALALVLTIVLALGVAVWGSRNKEIATWRTQLSNLTLILSQETSQEVTSAYLILDSIAESVAAARVSNEADFRKQMTSEAMFQSMRDKKQPLPQIDVATIVAANGDVLNFTRSYPAPKINLADRDYFREHLKDPALGVYISKPVRNKGNGQWTFYLSRRLSGAHGEFLGLALVGLSSEVLSDQFKKINLGEGAIVNLARRDGALVARWPHVDEMMGKPLPPLGEQNGVNDEARLNEVLVLTSPQKDASGKEGLAMMAERVVDPYPLILNISVTDDLFLSQWRHFTGVLVVVALSCIGAIAVAFWVLVKALMRRDAAIAATERLRDEAQAANRAKSDFLAMMSHEIRTPLTAIMGFAEILSGPGNQEVKGDAARVIMRNGQHLLGIINDILDISKIEADHLELEHVPFSPIETVWGLDSMMSAQARAKGIRFDLQIEYPFPSQVLGDPTRWKQVLFNLCSNAVKFTSEGSVLLTLWYDAASSKLMCNVVDTGIGISAEQKEKLFTPFVQADRSVARRFGGTGLGLYLVRRLSQAMGGGVELASEPGKGSVFEVAVLAPLAPGMSWLDQAPNLAHDGEPDRPSLVGQLQGSVLLVEDGPDNRQLVGALLSSLGLEVVFAENGEQGVERALSESVDVILMDIQMPVMDGMRATALIRAAGFAGPIVALTANVMTEDVRRYLANGFSHVLAKPIVRDQFENLLGQLCERRGAETEDAGHQDLASLPEYQAIQRAFVDSLAGRMAQLQAYVAAADWVELGKLAHILKGSAGSFGFPRSGMMAQAVEHALRKEQPQEAAALVPQLIACMEEEFKEYEGGVA
ncbi:hybrid sensor histidine kinase/response regulator [Massilia sp. TS11]|uniref:hybrid sensor histidine kinase/response regulator n=1 Tax=Massilia sp. TS11 TaxID=2908003 RepID=UPI001EDB9E05|nr:hybrid sensor histidine kinase/response regulator [Massilia sp. TS11]MCG2584752.1 ATP-binding protein [Massilia sp. TS11]